MRSIDSGTVAGSYPSLTDISMVLLIVNFASNNWEFAFFLVAFSDSHPCIWGDWQLLGRLGMNSLTAISSTDTFDWALVWCIIQQYLTGCSHSCKQSFYYKTTLHTPISFLKISSLNHSTDHDFISAPD